MAIIQPTQKQLAIMSLQKWVEKVAVNANTAELDALELVQLQRLLGTIIGTYSGVHSEIPVPVQGFEIKDTLFGTAHLIIPVSEEDGVLSIPAITVNASNDNTVKLLLSFVPDETVTGFTIRDALGLFQSIATELTGGPLTMTMQEFLTLDYLESVSGQDYNPASLFTLEINFASNQTKFEFQDISFPSLRSPILTTPVISDLTAATATVSGTYDYTGRKTISEVGVIISQTGETDVEHASSSVTPSFTVELTGLVDDVEYGVRTYIKFADGSGATSDVITLQGKDLPNVTSTAASDITTTTAKVGGSFVYDVENGVGPIAETGVELKISGGVYAEVVGLETESPFIVSLTELTLGSTYLYKAYVKIGENKYYGAELTFDTASA